VHAANGNLPQHALISYCRFPGDIPRGEWLGADRSRRDGCRPGASRAAVVIRVTEDRSVGIYWLWRETTAKPNHLEN
jgi:hypothetical protein